MASWIWSDMYDVGNKGGVEESLPGFRSISYKLPPNWRVQHCDCAWYASFPVATICINRGLIPQIQFEISPSVCECESIPVNAFQYHSIEGAMKWKVKIPLEDWMCVRSWETSFVLCAFHVHSHLTPMPGPRAPKPTQFSPLHFRLHVFPCFSAFRVAPLGPLFSHEKLYLKNLPHAEYNKLKLGQGEIIRA